MRKDKPTEKESKPEDVVIPMDQPVKLETVKLVGPCGDDNPCGGGFGAE